MGGRAFTESDVQNGKNNFLNAVEFAVWFTHPGYIPDGDVVYINDVGVVTLSEPVFLPDASDYGVLPRLDALDAAISLWSEPSSFGV